MYVPPALCFCGARAQQYRIAAIEEGRWAEGQGERGSTGDSLRLVDRQTREEEAEVTNMLKFAVLIEFQECYPTMSRASMRRVEPKTAPIVAREGREVGRSRAKRYV